VNCFLNQFFYLNSLRKPKGSNFKVTNNTKTPEEKTYRFWGMTLKAKLRIKCKNCGNWSIIEVKKIFVNSGTSDSKLKIFLPAYLPLKTENCSTCSQVIAKENGIIRARRRS